MIEAPGRNPELAILHTEAAGVIGLGLRSKSAAIRRLAPAIERYLALGYSLRQVLAVAGIRPGVRLGARFKGAHWSKRSNTKIRGARGAPLALPISISAMRPIPTHCLWRVL